MPRGADLSVKEQNMIPASTDTRQPYKPGVLQHNTP